MKQTPKCGKCGESGFTYIALLFTIVVAGITLASAGTVWSTVMKREKEEELLFRGGAIRSAIESYYKMTGIKGYPKTLEDLLDDKRQTFLTRHLRRIYVDPMTGKADWVLLKAPDGGIKGVKSRSPDEPLKKKSFSVELSSLEDKSGYSEWEFVYSPEAPPEEGGPAAPGKRGPSYEEAGPGDPRGGSPGQ
jgi:type II secretory pathway pseudopilin PulG